jgi:hypothetical protein
LTGRFRKIGLASLLAGLLNLRPLQSLAEPAL